MRKRIAPSSSYALPSARSCSASSRASSSRSSWKVTGAVPVDPEPAQRVLDLLDRLGDLAARVGVLDPQQALAALLAREQPVEEEGADTADVEEAGRARGHADADARHLSIVGRRWNSARTCPPAGASTRRSTGSRRSAATACRCSRRARACGGRRSTSRRRSSASRHDGPRRGSAASSATRSTSATSRRRTTRSTRSRSTTLKRDDGHRVAIEADAVIFHVGSHLGAGFEAASSGSSRGAGADPRSAATGDTWLLMENSAGPGGDDRPLAGGAARRSSTRLDRIRGSASASTRATSTPRATT